METNWQNEGIEIEIKKKKKGKENKHDGTKEERKRTRDASGVSSVDDMVHMPVNYPLSLSLAKHLTRAMSHSIRDSVWSRYGASYARLLC